MKPLARTCGKTRRNKNNNQKKGGERPQQQLELAFHWNLLLRNRRFSILKQRVPKVAHIDKNLPIWHR
jgi:hypothetical protein